jgi:long-chain acyl-CoA synthetase
MMRMGPRTVYSMLEESVAAYGDVAALHQPGGGKYESYTWPQYRDAVREIAVGLHEFGIGKGDIVALGSETRVEFYLADIGVMTTGAIAGAIYCSSTMADQIKALAVCGAKMAMLENPKYLKTLIAAGGDQLNVKWVLLTGFMDGVTTLADVRSAGREAMQRDPELFMRIQSGYSPRDTAILYLTSGATGEPKMVEVAHQALTMNCDMGPEALDIGPADCALAFLPSAHIAQRVAIEMLTMRMGVPVWFSESLAKMPSEFKSVRPSFFLAPPRVWERIYASVSMEIRKRSAIQQRIFWVALGIGSEAARYKREGKSVPGWLRRAVQIADKFVFAKIRERFGGRMRVAISGAAPLSKQLGEFYEAIGMPLMEGYGLTEGGIVSLNPAGATKLGSIGKPLPGVEFRLSDEKELLLKSPSLASGYFRDPEISAQVFVDGWLHTGDLGEIDADGYVYITGRKKEMIVSSSGKKVFPIRVEGLFMTEPLISQMLLLGDRQPFVTALFTVNTAAAVTLKGMEGMSGKPVEEIVNAPPVIAEVKRAVAKANKQLAPFEQIRKFRILDRDFSLDAGELTPTMKVRRVKVIENFRNHIVEMYAGKEENV